jgi:RHS repeat-associated protein
MNRFTTLLCALFATLSFGFPARSQLGQECNWDACTRDNFDNDEDWRDYCIGNGKCTQDDGVPGWWRDALPVCNHNGTTTAAPDDWNPGGGCRPQTDQLDPDDVGGRSTEDRGRDAGRSLEEHPPKKPIEYTKTVARPAEPEDFDIPAAAPIEQGSLARTFDIRGLMEQYASQKVDLDPIDLRRGEFLYTAVDLEVLGNSFGLSFVRTYRSRVNFSGPLGKVWDHNFNARVYHEAGTCSPVRTVSLGNAQPVHMKLISGGGEIGSTYETLSGHEKLSMLRGAEEGCYWRLELPSDRTYCFDESGYLQTIRNLHGDYIQLEYVFASETALIPRVKSAERWLAGERTHRINFEYTDSFFRLGGVAIYDGATGERLERVQYKYVNDQLVEVSDESGTRDTYTYTSPHAPDDIVSTQGLEEFCDDACGGETDRCGEPTACAGYVEPPLENPNCMARCKHHCDGKYHAEGGEWVRDYCMKTEEVCNAQLFYPGVTGSGGKYAGWYRWGWDFDKDLRIGCSPGYREDGCKDAWGSEVDFDDYMEKCEPECHPLCENAAADWPLPMPCKKGCKRACMRRATNPDLYKYGVPADLANNMLTVTDGDGRLVVKNEYGKDPREPSFDSVTTQWLGDTEEETTLEYYEFQDDPEVEPWERPGCFNPLEDPALGGTILPPGEWNCEKHHGDFDFDRDCCTDYCSCRSSRNDASCGDFCGDFEDCKDHEAAECVPRRPDTHTEHRQPLDEDTRDRILEYQPSGKLTICSEYESGGNNQYPIELPIFDSRNFPWVPIDELGSLARLDVLNSLEAYAEQTGMTPDLDEFVSDVLGKGIQLFELRKNGRLRARSKVQGDGFRIRLKNGVADFRQKGTGEFGTDGPVDLTGRALLAFAQVGTELIQVGTVQEIAVLTAGECNRPFRLKSLAADEFAPIPASACEGDLTLLPIAKFADEVKAPPSVISLASGGGRLRVNANRSISAVKWADAVSRLGKTGLDIFGEATETRLALPANIDDVLGAQAVLLALSSAASNAQAEVSERIATGVAEMRLGALFGSFQTETQALDVIEFGLSSLFDRIIPGTINIWVPDHLPVPLGCLERKIPEAEFENVAEDSKLARWATHVTDPDGKQTIAYYNDAGNNIRVAYPQRALVEDLEYDEQHNHIGMMIHEKDSLESLSPRVCTVYNDRHLPEMRTTIPFNNIGRDFAIQECFSWHEKWALPTVVTAPAYIPVLRGPLNNPFYGATFTFQAFYDELGNPTLTRDEAGNDTRHFYDSYGRRIRTTHPTGSQTSFLNYDPIIGQPRDVVENITGEQRKTHAEYDKWGHLESLDRAGWGPRETWVWTDRFRLALQAKIADGKRNITTYGHSGSARLENVFTPHLATTLNYGEDGRVSKRTVKARFPDADGKIEEQTECFKYFADGAVKKYTDPLGVVYETTREYAASSHELVEQTNLSTGQDPDCATPPDGGSPIEPTQIATVRRDAGDRVIHTTDASGIPTSITHDGLGRVFRVTDAIGVSAETHWDARGRLSRRLTLNPGHAAEPYYILTNSNPLHGHLVDAESALSNVSAAQNVTLLSYSVDGQRVSSDLWVAGEDSHLSRSQSSTTSVDAARRETSTRVESGPGEDATGAVTTTVRVDRLGRPVSTVAVSEPGNEISYSEATEYESPTTAVTTTLGPDGTNIVSKRTYGTSGLLETLTVAGKEVSSFDYDVLGRVTFAADEAGLTSFVHDAFGRVIETTRTTLDESETLETTATIYDARGRLDSVMAGDGIVASYQYDQLGRLTHESRPSSIGETGELVTRSTAYVGLTNKVHTRSLPSGRNYTYEYNNPRGLLDGVVAEASDELSELFDRYERPLFTGPKRATLTLDHGITGQVERASIDSLLAGPSGTSTYRKGEVNRVFDGAGRVLSETPTRYPEFGVTSEYGLGGARVLQQIGYQEPTEITRQYRPDGRPSAILRGSEKLVGFGYDGSGPASVIEYGAALTEQRSFDDRGRMTAQSLGDLSLSYGYGTDGFVRQLRRSAGDGEAASLLVELDAAGRIRRELRDVKDAVLPALPPGGIENAHLSGLTGDDARAWASYGYDNRNNWLRRTDNTGDWVPDPNPGNAYRNINDTVARYDEDGRLLEGDNRSFSYDVFGRLAAVREIESIDCTYDLDAFGRRYREDCGGEVTYFGWDGDNLVADRKGETGDVFVTIHGVGLNSPLARVTVDEDPVFLIQGRDRSVRGVADSDGNIIEAYEYTAFGETQLVSLGERATGNRLGYHGHLWDPQTGLYSMRARMYAPKWGRFLSQDPIGVAGGANLYAFVGNSPLDHWDPFGLTKGRNPRAEGLIGPIQDIYQPPNAWWWGQAHDQVMGIARNSKYPAERLAARGIGFFTGALSPVLDAPRFWGSAGNEFARGTQRIFRGTQRSNSLAAMDDIGGGLLESSVAVGKVTALVAGAQQLGKALPTGATRLGGLSDEAAGTVATPYGTATQETTPAAQAVLTEARGGATLYRQGAFGVQETTSAQFWSRSNPASTPGYAAGVGMPGGAAPKVDWIMGGTLRTSAPAITRGAPGIGTNAGGKIEVVVSPGGVCRTWFCMPD